MFAVIKTGGKQYKVSAGDEIEIEKLAQDPGAAVDFAEVLMIVGEDGAVSVGAPVLDGALVRAEILDQFRGPKTINFKRRRRKHSSARKKGHRQHLTRVRVTEIVAQA